jgi:hypothetical protein
VRIASLNAASILNPVGCVAQALVCGTLLDPANHLTTAALRALIAALIAARRRSEP